MAQATFATAINGGDPIKNIVVTLGAHEVANRLLPIDDKSGMAARAIHGVIQGITAAGLRGGRPEEVYMAIGESLGRAVGGALPPIVTTDQLGKGKASNENVSKPEQTGQLVLRDPQLGEWQRAGRPMGDQDRKRHFDRASSSVGAASARTQAGRSAPSSRSGWRASRRGGPPGRSAPPGGRPPRDPGGESPRRGLLFGGEEASPVFWHPSGSKGPGLSGGRSKTSGLVGGLLAASVVPMGTKTTQASRPTRSQSVTPQKQSVERSIGGQGLSSGPPVFLTAFGNYRDRSIGGFSAEPSFSPVVRGSGIGENGRGLDRRVPLYGVDYGVDYTHSRYTPSSRPGVWRAGTWYRFGTTPERQQAQAPSFQDVVAAWARVEEDARNREDASGAAVLGIAFHTAKLIFWDAPIFAGKVLVDVARMIDEPDHLAHRNRQFRYAKERISSDPLGVAQQVGRGVLGHFSERLEEIDREYALGNYSTGAFKASGIVVDVVACTRAAQQLLFMGTKVVVKGAALGKQGLTEAASGVKDFAFSHTFKGNQKYVSTGGLRNELPLTHIQKQEALNYAKRLGMSEQSITFSDNMNTSYKLLFGEERLYIGTDVLPASSSLSKANSRVTMKGAIAHEIIGHRAAELSGMSHSNLILEEAQASIRAARFAPGLNDTERLTLLRDAVERLHSAGYKVRDVKGKLWIESATNQKLKLKGF